MDWILTNERLPEKEGFYIFQVGHGGNAKVHEYYFDGENLKVDILDEETIFIAKNTVAWQPLPNRYLE